MADFMRVWWKDGQVIDYPPLNTPDLAGRRDEWKKAKWLTKRPSDHSLTCSSMWDTSHCDCMPSTKGVNDEQGGKP